MKQYHITSIEGKPSGPFHEADLQVMLADGKLSPDDFCWAEGMADWEPIKEVLLKTPPPLSAPQNQEIGILDKEKSFIYCTKCGERNPENNLKCTRCNHYLHESQPKASVV